MLVDRSARPLALNQNNVFPEALKHAMGRSFQIGGWHSYCQLLFKANAKDITMKKLLSPHNLWPGKCARSSKWTVWHHLPPELMRQVARELQLPLATLPSYKT